MRILGLMSSTRSQLFFEKWPLSFLTLGILLASCHQKQQSINPPDDTSAFYRDSAFWQEYHEAYTIGAVPVDNEVRSIVVDNHENVWIATPSGVFVKNHHEKV